MAVQCLTCAGFVLKMAPLGKHGFGRCQFIRRLGGNACQLSATFPRECDRHTPAKDAAERIAWAKRQGFTTIPLLEKTAP